MRISKETPSLIIRIKKFHGYELLNINGFMAVRVNQERN